MSLPELKHPGYTVEDWKLWDGRWELMNGVAYDMTPAPSLEHQRMSSKLHLAIGNALVAARRSAEGGECEIFAAPVNVYLGDAKVTPPVPLAPSCKCQSGCSSLWPRPQGRSPQGRPGNSEVGSQAPGARERLDSLLQGEKARLGSSKS